MRRDPHPGRNDLSASTSARPLPGGLRPAKRRLPHRGWRLGKLIVSHCIQGTGAQPIDHAFINDADGYRYTGVAILARPWRRNRHGERLRGPALVIGWRQ